MSNINLDSNFDTWRELDIRQTFFVPAWCIEKYPEAIETMLNGGHESTTFRITTQQ